MLSTDFSASLTKALGAEVTMLVADMRERLNADADRSATWREEFDRARKAERVAGAYSDWEQERLQQAAVGWALSTVFLRFIEDNELFGPGKTFISGHTSPLRQAARDREEQFYAAHPEQGYRGYLLDCFAQLAHIPATQGLVDDFAAFRLMEPSDDAAGRLISFWREVDSDGELKWALHDENLSTRFLGDMYQDLSDFARKKYALLQTPEFVEEFILERTLIPALKDRPLEGFKMIDPTCGSGHFLLGAFKMLLNEWQLQEPGADARYHAEKAMSSIHGVDINPFAVAISRFRLTVAYMQAAKFDRLSADLTEPGYTVLTGDTLLFGPGSSGIDALPLEGTDSELFFHPTEDQQELHKLLNPQGFDVVVGNPPYITVKDKALNRRYRERFAPYCKGTYAMTSPFTVLFFRLARGEDVQEASGWTGQITSNSFMQREFGKPIIEDFFPLIELHEVIDSSGAYIPGHGTPTVILVGKNKSPGKQLVRTVLGVQGEPGIPLAASEGEVWQSIVQNVDSVGFENEYVSIVDIPSNALNLHPWSLQGGSALSTAALIEESSSKSLSTKIKEVGRTVSSGMDPVFYGHGRSFKRSEITQIVPLTVGSDLRDFRTRVNESSIFPFHLETAHAIEPDKSLSEYLWNYRTLLRKRLLFGKNPEQRGMRWFDFSEFYESRFIERLGLAFSFVATHNHFVLDRGGKVFKQSAPVIKLPAEATEDDHLELLGVLNSSTACFWLKQNSHNKGSTVDTKGARTTLAPWEDFYEFTGTTLKRFPLPQGSVLERGRRLDSLAQELAKWDPEVLFESTTPASMTIEEAQREYYRLRELMIAEQEELDWAVYHLYGLTDQDYSLPAGEVDGIMLGTRAFEIALARRVEAGETTTAWFDRHHSNPVTEIPAHWPEEYQLLVEKRLELIDSDRSINLLERPEYKRRWADDLWEDKVHSALETWLLGRLETASLWFRADGMPQTRTIRELSGIIETSPEFSDVVEVLPLWSTKPGRTVLEILTELLKNEPVPYLKALRYKGRGIAKRAEWEATWEAQRREDTGEIGPEDVPVPPNYTSADMPTAVWRHRGKLDVPKERFISYQGASPQDDPTLRIGWAGWDHLQQGLALMSLYSDLKDEDASRETLGCVLSGLKEQLPWILQWHNDINPDMGIRLGDYLRDQLLVAASDIEVAVEDLENFVPVTTKRRAKKGQA